jgi:hypothetical protein
MSKTQQNHSMAFFYLQDKSQPILLNMAYKVLHNLVQLHSFPQNYASYFSRLLWFLKCPTGSCHNTPAVSPSLLHLSPFLLPVQSSLQIASLTSPLHSDPCNSIYFPYSRYFLSELLLITIITA